MPDSRYLATVAINSHDRILLASGVRSTPHFVSQFPSSREVKADTMPNQQAIASFFPLFPNARSRKSLRQTVAPRPRPRRIARILVGDCRTANNFKELRLRKNQICRKSLSHNELRRWLKFNQVGQNPTTKTPRCDRLACRVRPDIVS
jgi:hypothetical protein